MSQEGSSAVARGAESLTAESPKTSTARFWTSAVLGVAVAESLVAAGDPARRMTMSAGGSPTLPLLAAPWITLSSGVMSVVAGEIVAAIAGAADGAGAGVARRTAGDGRQAVAARALAAPSALSFFINIISQSNTAQPMEMKSPRTRLVALRTAIAAPRSVSVSAR